MKAPVPLRGVDVLGNCPVRVFLDQNRPKECNEFRTEAKREGQGTVVCRFWVGEENWDLGAAVWRYVSEA